MIEKLVLVVLWALSLCKGLDSSSEKHVPISLEETILGRNRGFCSTWGNGAFRTFDDKLYHFTSTCNYILSHHCKNGAEDFNIQIRRGSDGNLEHVFIQIEGVKILVVNGTISVQDAVIQLPYHDKVIGIYKRGIYTQLSNRKHTISVNWNNEDALWVTIDDKYQGQLCGLCGNFDINSSSNYDSNFLNTNKLDVLGHTCHSNPQSSETCEASSHCQAISSLFLSCFDNKVIGQYWKLCRADVCSCKGPGCQCATFAEIARHCDKAVFQYWENWRTQTECAFPTCPGNQIYKECGPSYIPTCTDRNPQQQSKECVNTCVCPEGKVLDNVRGSNRCITESACPCEYSGQIYPAGEIRNTSCQSCICESGKWACFYRSCPGRCTIEEATYFTTFDNTFYSLVGDCSYYAVLTNDWNIEVAIHQCQAAFKQTCLQRVTLTQNQTSIVFNNDGNIYLDGNEVASPLRTGEIIIFWQSSKFIQVATTFGLKMQVQIDPVMQLYISLSEDAKGSTKGLCGTFNDDADDDFLSAQSIVESTPITFANSWKTGDSCPEPTIPSPCVSSENEIYAKLHCSHLKDPVGAFSVCHSTVDYLKYYQMCVAATCACENINDCLCAGLGAYVHECAAHGVIVRNWRKDICNKPCANTQVFENDMKTCNRTCRSLSRYDYTCDVEDVPVFGCGCPEGKYMDNSGECIDKSDCSCYLGDTVIKKGQSINLNGRICTCENGKFSCPVVPTTTQPGCLNGKIYNDCTNNLFHGKSKAKTCRGRNIPSSSSRCVPGCVCPGNLVEDDTGRCIDPEQCPCLFGGESHNSGETIRRDCNKCTCRAGVWQCTTNPCPKTCQVHGDGQYLTFDGKRYMFDGNCEYIFAEDYCNRGNGTFQILTESVPCCENGVICSRNIKILLTGKEFILTDGKVIQSDKSRETQCVDSSYSLHALGLYLILKFSNGITVIWDKRTRASITLDPRWKNKVCGLCGNFNDDVADDLTTKGNSVVTNAVKFGSSWKSSLSCSDTMNQTFPCDRNPYCLAWAQRKCGIIKDAVFQKCHKKVDPTPFHDACVQEACACDLEGKYLGFCTAVAVYAEACNKAGVCVSWRTPDLCPVYCDYYNTPGECSWHYRPCGTLTTKTCSDHYIGKKFSAVLEGCYAKCPENAPYLDENKMKCVNVTECTCYYNGKILQPGETTSNDCEECECKNGKVTCRAPPKTTVKPTPPSTTTNRIVSLKTTVKPTPLSATTNRIEETTTRIIWETTSTETPPVIPTTTMSTTSYIPESTPPPGRPTTMTSTSSYIPEMTTPPERLTTITSTSSYIPETTPPPGRMTTTISTSSYLPETTSTPGRPTTTTLTSSYIPEEECNGEWSPWINDNTPTESSPGDSELLDPLRDELCLSSSDTINKIQCQFVDFPEWPVSQSIDNVTCDRDTGLVCTFNESDLEGRRFCYDYQIRVCCEPQITTEWTTTNLPETTSTNTIPETTPRPGRPTTATSTSSYIPETTSTPGRPTTTTLTSSYIPEEECNGEWSPWINDNTPTESSPGDSELLDPLRDELCLSSSDTINKIQCQFVDFPEWPVSQSIDNVTCDRDTGLVCTFSESDLEGRRFCYDYQIRVCCEPQITTEWTTTNLPETTSTTTIPETTPRPGRPTTTTSTSSYIPEEECNGEWSPWINDNTPTESSPGDSELLDPLRDELCLSSSDTINKIQCQFVDFPEWPVSQSIDNVTCDRDTGLVCTFSESDLEGRRFCYDYQIRVCCEPQITTEWTTTNLPETTSTTTIPETTPAPSRPTTATSTSSYIPETTSTPGRPTTTTLTSSYIPEEECNGEWSPWINDNTPTESSPGDSELLDPLRDELCLSSSDTINKIQCQFVDFPEWPVSQSIDNVTCDRDTGLVCTFNESDLEGRRFCYDYQIRVCCEPQITTEWTTTNLPETTSTNTIPETTQRIPTTTTLTSVYLPETTSAPASTTPTTTTPFTSYNPEEECNGEWSPWINDNTPTESSPGDSELLDPLRDELCLSSSNTINKIQCQFVDFPEWPVSQSIDNVTCDRDTGLVCTFSESDLEGRRFCYDYQIRVCCEPQITTEWTTTNLPETTSTNTIPETTPQIQKTTSITSTTSFVPETTPSIVTTTSATSSITETIPPIQTTTTSTTSYIPGGYTTARTSPIRTTTTEPYCNGVWSPWFNENTPSIQNKGDSELLETIHYKLCPFSPYQINDIVCEAVKFPQLPISEINDNVTCDINKGLICNYNEQTPKNHLMCLDYRIRVCCEPIQTSQATTTAIVPVVHSTIYEPLITRVTKKPLESCQCNSKPPRMCMETWKENCTMITCIRGDIFKIDPITCPALNKPRCNNNIEPVKVRTADGCCERWECDCECEIWGDPHYSTFDGIWYDFFENCTYTLVEERVPKYNFSVLVDNYFCLPFIKKSCPRGLIISYMGNVVHISTAGTYVLTVNGNDVRPPYNANGFIITKLGISTYISVPVIRTTITAYPNAFKIRVPEQYFLDNTQGQCGSCSHSPPQCIRRNGKAEPSDCCHKTAFDWRVQDSRKPYCQSAATNVPCIPAPTPPTCKPEETICDLIQSKPFKQCRERINLDKYLKTCIFDHCVINSTIDCASLETAALACASVGICVDWRPFTNGMCNYTCNQGFEYRSCQSKEDDWCKNNTLKAGEVLTPFEEGCFCPNGMLLSEDKSRCVSVCQICRDQFGQPREEGDTWEDANNPCISYECTEFGVVIRNISCNQDESCPESDRVYLNHCCFECRSAQEHCKVNKFNETIKTGYCEATFEATQCLGRCSSVTRYDFKRHRMDPYCQCCREDKTEKASVTLQCKNGRTRRVEYTSIKSCKCKDCGDSFQNLINKSQKPIKKFKNLINKFQKVIPKPQKPENKYQKPKSQYEKPKSKHQKPKPKSQKPKTK
ncbi:mucin-5AC-like isoform X3 [Stegostoma tigrinum]|uniref:mucin-5AC-like isoform X3 n=1 Tax=Stegostoma tigrinum TaxID=3053191 RepID=UPI0028707D86|nr:mucin-5AC-like isoform X3 [Stegostoma tigrinum]